MKATHVLMEEHQGIKLMLDILEEVSRRLSAGEDIEAKHLEQITEFIRVFADKCHHGKEEDLLFCSMEQAGFPRQNGPIGVMLQEHDLGRSYVRAMAEAIDRYKTGDRSAVSQIVKNAGSYVSLLRDHIEKEDNILYPMADVHLSEETQSQLVEDFERVEIEKIGAGKHEEFHQLLDELKRVYLS